MEPTDAPWALTLLREPVGERVWELVALDGFESNVARLYDHLKGRGDPGWRVDISPMFGVIWGSARAICRRLEEQGESLVGTRVLELACGLGLPAMVAAGQGARVVASDMHPDTWSFLERNLARNQVKLDYAALDLRNPEASGLDRFDLVLASDVLYAHDLPEVVAAAFARFMAPGGRGLLADPGRAWLDEFLEACADRGLAPELEVETVPRPEGEDEIFLVELVQRDRIIS